MHIVNSANVLSATTENDIHYTIKLVITIDSVMDHLKYRFVASYYRYIRNCLQEIQQYLDKPAVKEATRRINPYG